MLIASRTITLGIVPTLTIDIWTTQDLTATEPPKYVITLDDVKMVSEIRWYDRTPEQTTQSLDAGIRNLLISMVDSATVEDEVDELYVYLKKVN